jgi:hypothetical protein
MTELDYIVTKNRFEILLLKAQYNLSNSELSKSKLEAVEVMQDTLKLIIEQRIQLDEQNKKNKLLILQNVKAYKNNKMLKNKLKK